MSAPTLDGGEIAGASIVVDASSYSTHIGIDQRQFACPKHGVTTAPAEGGFFCGNAMDRTPHIQVNCGPEELHGHFCLICYAEWINATIPRLTLAEPK